MTHNELWTAIEQFASDHKLSCSGLAKRSGLDSTTFNKSKRYSSVGQERWPSTLSLSKILSSTGAKLTDLTKHLPNA